MASSRNLDLEQAIGAHPRDTHGYLVYADWLQEQGDPRGELIALQHALRAAPDPGLKAREAVFLREHAAHLFGPLAHNSNLRVVWNLGFFLSVHLVCGERAWLDQLLDLGSARLMRELIVMPAADSSWRDVAALVGKRPLPLLLHLRVDDLDVSLAELAEADGLSGGEAAARFPHYGTLALPEHDPDTALPYGSMRRLGSVRFAHASHMDGMCVSPDGRHRARG